MDIIKQIRDKQQLELETRMGEYDSTCFICGHLGDSGLLQAGEMLGVVVSTAKELVENSTSLCIVRDPLTSMLANHAESVGLRLVVLDEIPGQIADEAFNQAVSQLKRISFAQLMGDIAETRRAEENMTQQELDASKARSQQARLTSKSGVLKQLSPFDFDRSSEADIAPDDSNV